MEMLACVYLDSRDRLGGWNCELNCLEVGSNEMKIGSNEKRWTASIRNTMDARFQHNQLGDNISCLLLYLGSTSTLLFGGGGLFCRIVADLEVEFSIICQ